MNFLKKIMLSAVITVMSVVSAQATIITLNGTTEVGVLELNESFIDFYDHNNSNKWSSNTGLEELDTVVMFLASYNNQLALFTLADGYNANGTTSGKLHANYSAMTDIGSILFVDDSNDANSDNGNSWSVNWAWGDKYADGMIFLFDNANSFNLDIAFSNFKNINDSKFLSFNQQGQMQSIDISETSNLTAVPEPSSIAVLAIGLIALASRRRTQNK